MIGVHQLELDLTIQRKKAAEKSTPQGRGHLRLDIEVFHLDVKAHERSQTVKVARQLIM